MHFSCSSVTKESDYVLREIFLTNLSLANTQKQPKVISNDRIKQFFKEFHQAYNGVCLQLLGYFYYSSSKILRPRGLRSVNQSLSDLPFFVLSDFPLLVKAVGFLPEKGNMQNCNSNLQLNLSMSI